MLREQIGVVEPRIIDYLVGLQADTKKQVLLEFLESGRSFPIEPPIRERTSGKVPKELLFLSKKSIHCRDEKGSYFESAYFHLPDLEDLLYRYSHIDSRHYDPEFACRAKLANPFFPFERYEVRGISICPSKDNGRQGRLAPWAIRLKLHELQILRRIQDGEPHLSDDLKSLILLDFEFFSFMRREYGYDIVGEDNQELEVFLKRLHDLQLCAQRHADREGDAQLGEALNRAFSGDFSIEEGMKRLHEDTNQGAALSSYLQRLDSVLSKVPKFHVSIPYLPYCHYCLRFHAKDACTRSPLRFKALPEDDITAVSTFEKTAFEILGEKAVVEKGAHRCSAHLNRYGLSKCVGTKTSRDLRIFMTRHGLVWLIEAKYAYRDRYFNGFLNEESERALPEALKAALEGIKAHMDMDEREREGQRKKRVHL